jgi:hypothetical protein
VKCPAFAAAAALLMCACSHKDIQNKDAIRSAVVDYLNKRSSQTGLDMNLMNVEVSSVSYENNEARATVAFRPKNSDTGGMSMNYVLERRGDHWVVKGRSESGMNPHGAQGMPPAQGEGGMQPMPPGAGGMQPLPPGHPPTGGKSEGK